MGCDKALLDWRGERLVEWIARQVREAAGSAALVGAPERYAGLGFACLGERYPGAGPLSGIEAALRQGGAEFSLIVACDMPLLDAAALSGLLRTAESSGGQVTAARGLDGAAEPLCAVYHRSALPAAESALGANRLRLRDLLAELAVECWEPPSRQIALNVNTPEQWERMTRGAGR
jgi:molybdopterin-guanine dinucleotide biosynthesis protein A